jgi:hypothetical protein
MEFWMDVLKPGWSFEPKTPSTHQGAGKLAFSGCEPGMDGVDGVPADRVGVRQTERLADFFDSDEQMNDYLAARPPP